MKITSNKILSAAVLLLLVVNTVLLIFMWREKGKHSPRRSSGGGPFETMAKELNMTEQQKKDYQKLRDEHFAAIRPLFDSIREIRKEFMGLVKETNISSDSALNVYSGRIARKQAIIDKLTFDHLQKARALFSGDQQKQFDEFVQKMMQQRMNGPRRRDTTKTSN
jgi:hypothetical protein